MQTHQCRTQYAESDVFAGLLRRTRVEYLLSASGKYLPHVVDSARSARQRIAAATFFGPLQQIGKQEESAMAAVEPLLPSGWCSADRAATVRRPEETARPSCEILVGASCRLGIL